MKLPELAAIVKGGVIGNSQAEIVGTCAVDKYVKNKVSFVSNPKYGEALARLQDAVILIPEDLVSLCESYPQNTYIVVEDVMQSLVDVQDFFYGNELTILEEGISPTAKIDKSAKIGTQVFIGENVCIGRDTFIYPQVCIHKNCQIGNDCIIHSGVVIGGDGFRFMQDIGRKRVRKMIQAGRVIIGDRVEICANSTIARATFEDDATIISDDVKIDELVHIGHNAKIGARTLITGQACIAGSVKIGEDAWIGTGATISDNVSIGDRAKVLLSAVVAYDVPEDEMVSGFYAMPHRQWKRVYKKLKEEV